MLMHQNLQTKLSCNVFVQKQLLLFLDCRSFLLFSQDFERLYGFCGALLGMWNFTERIDLKSFWGTDLDELEKQFLHEKKITDLDVFMDNRIPPQGSVGLSRTVNVDQVVAKFLAKAR